MNTVLFHYEVLRVVKSIDTESRMVDAKDWEEEREESYCLMGIEFQFGKMKKFRRWMWWVIIAQQYECT